MKWLKELNKWEFDKVEWILLHYENCRDCHSLDVCPSHERMEQEVELFEFLHELFEGKGVEVRVCKRNSSYNSKLMQEEPYPGVPELVELNVFVNDDEAVFCNIPHYNFFLVQYRDGRRRLHTVSYHHEEEDVIQDTKEGCGCPMHY